MLETVLTRPAGSNEGMATLHGVGEERKVDPEGILDPQERARRAEMARKATSPDSPLDSAEALSMKSRRKK
jgi:hypothetical protein